MSDDHAMNAISCYGNSVNQTPNIDRIAEEGIRFNQSFCTNAICAPSRAVMLTGKYSHINGHINNSVSFDGSQQTFPQILQQNNYQTALIGKWHLKSDPTGFDYWNILPGQGSYYNPDFIEMGEKKSVEGYVTDLITEYTVNWLDHRDTTKPFCLLMHHKAPHRSWMPNLQHINSFDSVDIPIPNNFFDNYENRSSAAREQKMSIWKDMSLGYDLKLSKKENATEIIEDLGTWAIDRLNEKQRQVWDASYMKKNNDFHQKKPKGKELALWKYNRYMQDYLATIESVDESVGEILDYLDKNGLAENTIVIYTSDQGFYLGEHGWFDKRFMYEESLKMPLLIRYPKEIIKAISDKMVMNLDFAPTFLDYAGIQVPKDMQGESMRNILKSEKTENWRKEIYYHYYEYPGGGHAVKRHYGIRTNRYKLIHYYFDIDEWELFDLHQDPNEMNNLYNNPEYEDILSDLKHKLIKIREKYKDNNQDDFLPLNPIKRISHLAMDADVSYQIPYAKKYSGGGSQALLDGIISVDDLSQVDDLKIWQGFEGDDMIVTIDLKKEIPIHSISMGFLQNIDAWIFAPDWVELLIGSDNKSLEPLQKIIRPVSSKSPAKERISYSIDFETSDVRYIRVHAKNPGICPEWHKGAGYPCWIFADEIIIH
jgi:arylsulfatase A-like enzyme